MRSSPDIIFQDDDLLVLCKPSGWVVYGTRPEEAFDMTRWAREAFQQPHLSAVHRIDRETSGLVLMSAKADVRRELGMDFASSRVQKAYQCLVYGRARQKGIIRRDLMDQRRRRPLPAVTRYRTLAWYGQTSLLRVRPETGRKHQIRRHLQSIGHPLVGDDRYRAKRFRPVAAFPGRLWLHAAALTLPDGRSFESPLPPRLRDQLEVLEERERARQQQAG